jgi:hypothetical protein
MSETIVVNFSGDCWYNPTQFQEQLNRVPPGKSVILDMHGEGPSLQALGVTDVIDSWLRDRRQSPDSVQLYRWSNPVEFVPYRLVKCSNPSHFFFMSQNYWLDQEPSLDQQLCYHNLFGLFLGRITYARAVILYQCLVGKQNIFVSKMSSPNPFPWQLNPQDEINLDSLSDWLSTNRQYRMFEWYDKCTIPSVDQMTVRDQYTTPDSYADTNRSLLNYYSRFAIEVVCETYTMGNTFFPTEKTIRPIMACKPMLVYGPRYFLARLRTMGFQTYHDLWDESYDFYQGAERWQAMQIIIQSISEKTPDEQQQLVRKAHEIAKHNRQWLQQIVNHQVDLHKYDYKNI